MTGRDLPAGYKQYVTQTLKTGGYYDYTKNMSMTERLKFKTYTQKLNHEREKDLNAVTFTSASEIALQL